MNKILSNKKAITVFMAPAMLIIVVIVLVPIVISLYYSLLKWDGIGKATFIGIENYINLFGDERFIASVKNSLLYVVLSLFIQLPLSLLLAIVVSNTKKLEKFYVTVFFIPVIISSVVIGQLWQKVYNGDYGLLNVLLRSLGYSGHDWLGDEKTALMCSFIPNLWQYIGYHMLIMYAGIKSISTDISEAAKIDGANRFQTAMRITIPILKPIIQVCVTFSLIGALKIFDLIFVLTGGGPFQSTEVPTIYMYKTTFDQMHYGYGSAISTFVIIECFLFTAILRFIFKNREDA